MAISQQKQRILLMTLLKNVRNRFVRWVVSGEGAWFCVPIWDSIATWKPSRDWPFAIVYRGPLLDALRFRIWLVIRFLAIPDPGYIVSEEDLGCWLSIPRFDIVVASATPLLNDLKVDHVELVQSQLLCEEEKRHGRLQFDGKRYEIKLFQVLNYDSTWKRDENQNLSDDVNIFVTFSYLWFHLIFA